MTDLEEITETDGGRSVVQPIATIINHFAESPPFLSHVQIGFFATHLCHGPSNWSAHNNKHLFTYKIFLKVNELFVEVSIIDSFYSFFLMLLYFFFIFRFQLTAPKLRFWMGFRGKKFPHYLIELLKKFEWLIPLYYQLLMLN